MSTFETIAVTSEAGVMTITLNRPETYNAFNDQMSVELGTALRTASREDSIRCLVLTGTGKAFCSGQDLADIKGRYENTQVGDDLDFGTHLRKKYNGIIQRLRTIEKPVIAAVNGIAAGAGASFAFACDLRIATKNASFMMAFVNVGLVPDSGATQTLIQHVGYGRAAELCFFGQKMAASEAQHVGLVNRLVQDEAELRTATQEWAEQLASMPTRAIGLTKRALRHAWTSTLEDQLEYEAFLQHTAGNTADHREGVTAFLEKRKPEFRGE